MKRKIPLSMVVALMLLLMTNNLVYGQEDVTFETELNRLYEIGDLPAYRDGTVVKQVSSYDRTGGNDDGFGGTYSFIRKEPNGDLVIFDEVGQGVIERLWTPTPTDDTLDFYIDGSDKPTFSIKFKDLYNNTQAPFLAPLADHKVGGFYSYIPIPYKESCKIVFRGEKILFHQIQFRTYDKRYKVESYNPTMSVKQRPLLDKIITQWNKKVHHVDDFVKSTPKKVEKNISLKPGETETVFELDRGGRLLGIELSPDDVFAGTYKQIDLKITWDQEERPAVYVPVADFFGFAFGTRSMESLLIGANGDKAYSYIPMPFDKYAKVELVYRQGNGAEAVKLSTSVYYDHAKRDAENEGRFYAFWKNEDPAIGEPFVFLEGQGRGHYVGTIMQGQATDYQHFTEFFEGDDYTEIDGQMTVHGTGSEDYFNGGWYAQPGGWVERLGAPLTGCLEYSLPLGRTGGYRLFISDKMPFSNRIMHQIEHGPTGNNRMVNYISVAMYYAENAIATQKVPNNELTSVYKQDKISFYTGLMEHLRYKGDLEKKERGAVLAAEGDGELEIAVSDVPEGLYDIYLHSPSSDDIDIRVGLPGDQSWVSVSREGGDTDQDLKIGRLRVDEGVMSVQILLKNVKSADLVFDRVTFAEVQ